jgi:hypothetical protein
MGKRGVVQLPLDFGFPRARPKFLFDTLSSTHLPMLIIPSTPVFGQPRCLTLCGRLHIPCRFAIFMSPRLKRFNTHPLDLLCVQSRSFEADIYSSDRDVSLHVCCLNWLDCVRLCLVTHCNPEIDSVYFRLGCLHLHTFIPNSFISKVINRTLFLEHCVHIHRTSLPPISPPAGAATIPTHQQPQDHQRSKSSPQLPIVATS